MPRGLATHHYVLRRLEDFYGVVDELAHKTLIEPAERF